MILDTKNQQGLLHKYYNSMFIYLFFYFEIYKRLILSFGVTLRSVIFIFYAKGELDFFSSKSKN